MADYLVVGVCLAHRGALLTRNLDRFARVPDLSISGRYLERLG
jgi:predicted nucleic acid-binding protein